MFTTLDPKAIALLGCPLCKSPLDQKPDAFLCHTCSTAFPSRTFSVGDHEESVFDFRIQYPPYCVPPVMRQWSEAQVLYEDTQTPTRKRDTVERFLQEIDAGREIFEDEFHLKGRVLDVGGHLGKLRHFLKDDTELYVSIDPYWNAFEDIQQRVNLLRAYPCIQRPCNFLAASAEHLPFAENSFDWVAMRSVVDHFADPLLAFKEAYRVVAPGGHVMIGLAIIEKLTARHSKKRRNIAARCLRKLKKGKSYSFRDDLKVYGGPDDDHMYRFKHRELLELLTTTGFEVDKEHWQKEPMDYCLYVTGRKNP